MTARLPKEINCPDCGHGMTSATSVEKDKKDEEIMPTEGDVCLCISCSSLLIYNADLTVRVARPGEIEITEEIRRAQRAIRMMDRRDMK
jgi:hypothetical protein